MQIRTSLLVVGFALCLGVTSSAQAGLMITQTAGDPSVGNFQKISPTGDTLSSYSLAGGDINFWYGNNTSNALIGLPNSIPELNGDIGWWDNTYPIYTTGVPSQSSTIWIDLSGINAYGFSFQIGANARSYGWFDVYYSGQANPVRRSNIPIDRNVSPGFQIATRGGSCDTIDKVRVDPSFIWGVFNMGVDTTGGNCVSVPEPSSFGLFGIGLLGLGWLRFKRNGETKRINTHRTA